MCVFGGAGAGGAVSEFVGFASFLFGLLKDTDDDTTAGTMPRLSRKL